MSLNVNGRVKVDKYDRYEPDEVVRGLESKLAEVLVDGTIEIEWKSFQKSIKLNRSFTVDERTQCSLDMIQELTDMNMNAPGGAIVTRGTNLHHQKRSNLCVYFSVTSAIRHEMKKIIGRGDNAIGFFSGFEILPKLIQNLKIPTTRGL